MKGGPGSVHTVGSIGPGAGMGGVGGIQQAGMQSPQMGSLSGPTQAGNGSVTGINQMTTQPSQASAMTATSAQGEPQRSNTPGGAAPSAPTGLKAKALYSCESISVRISAVRLAMPDYNALRGRPTDTASPDDPVSD